MIQNYHSQLKKSISKDEIDKEMSNLKKERKKIKSYNQILGMQIRNCKI